MPNREYFLLQTPANELLPHLEELSQTYKLPFGSAQRYGIKGVRTSQIDILIQCSDYDYMPVLEIGTREGERWRLCIRKYNISMKELLPVSISISKYSEEIGEGESKKKQGRCVFEILDPVGERIWCWSGQYFTEVVDDWWGIYKHHHTKFYPFLKEQDVIDQFGGDVLPNEATINQANRFVSRSLYRLARDLGYRRNTNRKSQNFQKWEHETKGLVHMNENGCGDCTNQASSGKNVEFNAQEDD